MWNRRGLSHLGLYLYAFGSFAAGVFDLVWGNFDTAHQPLQAWGDNIPGATVFAYVTGVWMVAGAVAPLLAAERTVAGVALAAIYFIFALFWLPRFYTAPHYLGFRIPVYIGVFSGVGSQLYRVRRRSAGLGVAGTAQFVAVAGSSCYALDLRNLRHRLRSGASDRHQGQPRVCPEVAASGSGVLGDRHRSLLRARRVSHTHRNSGRAGGLAAGTYVPGFQSHDLADLHFCPPEKPRSMGRERVQPGSGGIALDTSRGDCVSEKRWEYAVMFRGR